MKAVARVLLPTVTFLLIHILVWNVIAYMYPEGSVYGVSWEEAALGQMVYSIIGVPLGLLIGSILEIVNRLSPTVANTRIVILASLTYGVAYEYGVLYAIGIV